MAGGVGRGGPTKERGRGRNSGKGAPQLSMQFARLCGLECEKSELPDVKLHNVIITIIILTSTLSYRPNKQNMGSTHNSVLLVAGIQMTLASNSRPSEAQWSTKHLG
ncbi:unnamed protein product [Rangifer tarandus platyrhynchus]|uniref:Uncharacterized protein n=2 Tax=Rangifer tarandus platyrhynchus TaxID=3082113 RepID=A0AC59Z8M0_RANTA|nr:unnamed protein product [Rangifer tarandus platyrhynchus]